jgi:hypothetical protein
MPQVKDAVSLKMSQVRMLTAYRRSIYTISDDLRPLPPIKDRIKRTIKMKNRIFAMDAAPAAMPKNPKTPAMIAMTRKMTVQRNIVYNLNDE